MDPKKAILLQNNLLAPKHFCSFCGFGAQNAFWRKFAFLRPHVADAYKTNGIWIKMEPFLAQKRFWAKKCILGPRIDFWAQSAKNGPEMHFWAQKCILGPECTFCAKSDFWAKSAILSKKCTLELSRTHIPLAIFATRRARNPKSANFAQKSILGQKYIFGLKN